jgi:hypothetical protein
MKQATSSKQLTDEQAEKAGNDLDAFKGFFPSGKVSKGRYMLITRRGSDGALLLEYEVSIDESLKHPTNDAVDRGTRLIRCTYQGKLLGTLQNRFLSKQMLLAYFADNDKEISPKVGLFAIYYATRQSPPRH